MKIRENDVYDSAKEVLNQISINRPFSEFWIHSSHNIYLPSNQWKSMWSGTNVNVMAFRTTTNPVVKYIFTIGILLFYRIMGVLWRGVMWSCLFGAREEEEYGRV